MNTIKPNLDEFDQDTFESLFPLGPYGSNHQCSSPENLKATAWGELLSAIESGHSNVVMQLKRRADGGVEVSTYKSKK